MENKRLFGKLCYLHREMCRENNVLFAENGISPVQLHAMIHIHRAMIAGERVCQKDVEKYVNLRASSVSALLTNLERGGFVRRIVSEGDARTKYIELTEKGKEICLRNRMLMDNCDGVIQSALTGEEQSEFETLLNKIIDSISKQEKL